MAEQRETVNGDLCIEVFVTCPSCKTAIDLMELDEFTDDGFLLNTVCPSDGTPWADSDPLDTDLDC